MACSVPQPPPSSHGPFPVNLCGAVTPQMPTTVDTAPGRSESSSSDQTVAANETPYYVENAEAIGLVPETQRVDCLSLEEQEDEDIYRGERPRSPSVSSSSSSSSSASSVFGGRLGAISAVVEHAIATWARAWASTSTLSSDTSSSSSASLRTVTRSLATRARRRRSSVADVHNQRSERQIAARIKAREEWRNIPRFFDLYVPNPSMTDALEREGLAPGAEERKFIHTNSLPLIISQLGAALKGNERARRARTETISPAHPRPSSPPMQFHHYMMPNGLIPSTSASSHQEPSAARRARKGKRRAIAHTAPTPMSHTPSGASDAGDAEKAWWLDVSSPTWEDMRAIGKVYTLPSSAVINAQHSQAFASTSPYPGGHPATGSSGEVGSLS